MSLYNLINGVNPAAFYILPMLGKHPDEYPRFRDCFVGDREQPKTKDKIVVYTRTGGSNRETYAEENAVLTQMPGYLFDYDDEEDNTYAYFVFDVPTEWLLDFTALRMDHPLDPPILSPKYRARMDAVYPKLKNQFEKMFGKYQTSEIKE